MKYEIQRTLVWYLKYGNINDETLGDLIRDVISLFVKYYDKISSKVGVEMDIEIHAVYGEDIKFISSFRRFRNSLIHGKFCKFDINGEVYFSISSIRKSLDNLFKI